MHPLITAHVKLRELLDMGIRSWSPYHHYWVRFIFEQRRFILELEGLYDYDLG